MGCCNDTDSNLNIVECRVSIPLNIARNEANSNLNIVECRVNGQ